MADDGKLSTRQMEIVEKYQVVISSYNCGPYLQRCFDSINKIFKNKEWILLFIDDASEDDTQENLQKILPSLECDFYVVKKLPKAISVGMAKNRVLKLAKKYEKEYPIICPMDADDEMGPDRLKLYPEMERLQASFVYGGYKIFQSSGNVLKVNCMTVYEHLRFGWWSTLFHASLIPENENFFREDFIAYEELLKWWELKYKNKIKIHPIKNLITHHYLKRTFSVSDVDQGENVAKLLFEKNKIHRVPS